MKTSERIAELDKQRGAKVAAMQELLEKGSSESRTLTDDENGVFQNLKTDIGTIQRDLDNLREMESIIAKHAQVAGGRSDRRSRRASTSRRASASRAT